MRPCTLAGVRSRGRKATTSRSADSSHVSSTRAQPALGDISGAFWYLDSPQVTQRWHDAASIEVRGWIASPAPIESVRFLDGRLDRHLGLLLVDRPDVVAQYGLCTVGFEASGPVSWGQETACLELAFVSGGVASYVAVPAHDRCAPADERRRRKLDRVAGHLRCPRCREPVQANRRRTSYACAGCGGTYAFDGRGYDFLPDDLRRAHRVVSTDNVSSNDYDGCALNVIHRNPSALILDCGAGRRSATYENVVNVDIVDYDSTDVLAVGQSLPFADDTFEAVFSFAVLEHVKDPFACSRELIRVLRPGGVLYAQVPFLSPLHAYPDHYYNMTSSGLRNLFTDLEIHHTATIPFGQPVFALSWFLNEYCSGLPAPQRDAFERLTVKELLSPGHSYLAAEFVTALSAAARDALACTNYVLATKPAAR